MNQKNKKIKFNIIETSSHSPSASTRIDSSQDENNDMEIESAYTSASSDYENSTTTTSTPSSSPSTSQPASHRSSREHSHRPTSNQLVIINGQLTNTSKTQKLHSEKIKKYHCDWVGCQKSYTKPIRLEEHLRSHTNERPFSCDQCPATYRRETHLTAHKKMHLPESSRPLLCGWQDPNHSAVHQQNQTCQRRFWTQQHLKIHRENVHEGKKDQVKLKCQICSMEFVKHNSLRSHFIQAHCPKDTPKPYICPIPSCSLSFSHPSRLRKHERTHDPFRYTCVHEDCLNNTDISIQQRSFSSWTDLQRHTRDVHRFICPSTNCNRHKKPFKTGRSLQQHIQSYHSSDNQDNDSGVLIPNVVASRNTGSFICTGFSPCECAYKSARALQRHVNLKHLNDQHTSCPFEGCTFSSAFPSGITRHVKSKHSNHATTEQESERIETNPRPDNDYTSHKRQKLTRVEKLTQMDLLTGIGYSSELVDHSNHISITTPARKFACPFYDLHPKLSINLPPHHSSPFPPQNTDQNHSVLIDKCLLRFNRLYDIQRHLLSFHSLSVDRQILKNFYGVV